MDEKLRQIGKGNSNDRVWAKSDIQKICKPKTVQNSTAKPCNTEAKRITDNDYGYDNQTHSGLCDAIADNKNAEQIEQRLHTRSKLKRNTNEARAATQQLRGTMEHGAKVLQSLESKQFINARVVYRVRSEITTKQTNRCCKQQHREIAEKTAVSPASATTTEANRFKY